MLDPSTDPMMIYRPGAVTVEQIRAITGPVKVYQDTESLRETPSEALPSPGGGLRHYAPRARLVLLGEPIFGAPLAELAKRLADAARDSQGERLGVMLPAGVAAPPGIAAERVYAWGSWSAPEELAQRLYAGLRALDAAGCTVILCPLPDAGGLGAAIRDRLRKAGNRE